MKGILVFLLYLKQNKIIKKFKNEWYLDNFYSNLLRFENRNKNDTKIAQEKKKNR